MKKGHTVNDHLGLNPPWNSYVQWCYRRPIWWGLPLAILGSLVVLPLQGIWFCMWFPWVLAHHWAEKKGGN